MHWLKMLTPFFSGEKAPCGSIETGVHWLEVQTPLFFRENKLSGLKCYLAWGNQGGGWVGWSSVPGRTLLGSARAWGVGWGQV